MIKLRRIPAKKPVYYIADGEPFFWQYGGRNEEGVFLKMCINDIYEEILDEVEKERFIRWKNFERDYKIVSLLPVDLNLIRGITKNGNSRTEDHTREPQKMA